MLAAARILRRSAIAVLLASAVPALAQTVRMGVDSSPGGNVDPGGVQTILSLVGANLDGTVTSATFGWSAAPCPAAVKIKFFRGPAAFPQPDSVGRYDFVTERGPFGVTAPVDPSSNSFTQTVALSPPVEVVQGDVIAIVNLTSCGGPKYVALPSVFANTAVSFPGDVTSRVDVRGRPFLPGAILLSATGPSPQLGLLGDRYSVRLVATDPRTHATAEGVPVKLGDGAGYFSLPAFTGDATIPEVTVKMVDAARFPELGGSIWFFYAPLTDVQFFLSVRPRGSDVLRSYSNDSGRNGVLCGAADTSAFP